MAMNVWWPSYFSCFSSTSMKRKLKDISAFSQVMVKQRTSQFLISHWKLMQAWRLSSLLSNACTLQQKRSMPPGLQPVSNPSTFTSVLNPMLRWTHKWKQRWFIPSTFCPFQKTLLCIFLEDMEKTIYFVD